MDFDYDQGEEYGGRILWPRIGVFVAVALLVFLLGRCTGGGGGADEGALTAAVQSNSEATALLSDRDATIAELQQRLVEAQASGGTGGGTTPGAVPGSEGPTTTDGESDAAGTTPTNPGTYVVQPGDTLTDIAEQVYGDPLAFAPIAEANGLTGDTPIQEGQTLTIPDNPDAGQ